jgi:hypothetical protein
LIPKGRFVVVVWVHPFRFRLRFHYLAHALDLEVHWLGYHFLILILILVSFYRNPKHCQMATLRWRKTTTLT